MNTASRKWFDNSTTFWIQINISDSGKLFLIRKSLRWIKRFILKQMFRIHRSLGFEAEIHEKLWIHCVLLTSDSIPGHDKYWIGAAGPPGIWFQRKPFDSDKQFLIRNCLRWFEMFILIKKLRNTDSGIWFLINFPE